MDKNCIVPYAKENNLLQLPLYFFGKSVHIKKKWDFEWSDKEGSYKLTCACERGVPGSFEQDVYTGCMRIWISQGMSHGKIVLNYSDIARALELKPVKAWVGKIKKSLKKLALARYEFVQCFIKADKEGNNKVSTFFSLFDSASLFEHEKGKSKKDSKTILTFPNIIQENLEAKYYQMLDMVWYRSLPEGLPRRLYEYLAKRKYHSVNGVFIISEEALCRWLPIRDKNPTNRRKRLKRIADALISERYLVSYSFDKRKKHCVFAYERNSIPRNLEIKKIAEQNVIDTTSTPVESNVSIPQRSIFSTVQNQQYYIELYEWLNSIPYFHKRKKQEIISLPMMKVVDVYQGIRAEYEILKRDGKKPKGTWIYRQFMEKCETLPEKRECRHEIKLELPKQMELFVEPKQLPETSSSIVTEKNGQERLDNLLRLVREAGKRVTRGLREKIEYFYSRNGYEYVKWNIVYANKKAKKNYTTYLKRALDGNWAVDFEEEEKKQIERARQIQEENEKKEEENRKRDEEIEKAQNQRPLFLQKVGELEQRLKETLWVKAEKQIPKDNMRREMSIKIEYARLVLEHLIDQGEHLNSAILDRLDFVFIKEIACDF